MKGVWLFIAGIYFCSLHISSFFVFIIFLILSIFYYIRHYSFNFLVFLLIISSLFFHINDSVIEPSSKILSIKEVRSNYYIAETNHIKVLMFSDEKLNFGDIVYVFGKFELIDTVANVDDFCFEKWAERHKIFYQINVSKCEVIGHRFSIRGWFYNKIQTVVNKKHREWIKSMLFSINEEDVHYLMSSSGIHIIFLIYFIEKILQRFISKNDSFIISIIICCILGMLTHFSTSLFRTIIFKTCKIFFDVDRIDLLGISIIVCLILFPYFVYELGFLLPVTFSLVSLFNCAKRGSKYLSFCILIPFQFLYFNNCNIIQIALFGVLRKFYALIYMLSLFYMMIPIGFLFDVIINIEGLLNPLLYLGINVNYHPGIIWFIIWFITVIRFISIKKYKPINFLFLLIFTILIPYCNPFGEIYIMDVGQGDCALISLPFGQGNMLIDVMGSLNKNIPKDIIVPQLKLRGINKLDLVVLTHDDYDHSGGLKQLQECIRVDRVVKEKSSYIIFKKYKIPCVLHTYQGKDENEDSIILYMDFFGVSYMFMGDAGVEVENEILKVYPKIKCDVLKLGHHGSITSSSIEFLHQLNPQLALISSGRNNRYNHPHPAIIDRLRNENIYSLITAKDGGISIKFCKFFTFFRTGDNDFGIIKHGD